MLSSAAVESTAASFVKSACTSPDTPSSKLSSAAVDVIAAPPRFIVDVLSVVLLSVVIVCEVVVPPTTPLIVGAVSVFSVRVWAPASPTRVVLVTTGRVKVISLAVDAPCSITLLVPSVLSSKK